LESLSGWYRGSIEGVDESGVLISLKVTNNLRMEWENISSFGI
jgi:hypothetical protein